MVDGDCVARPNGLRRALPCSEAMMTGRCDLDAGYTALLVLYHHESRNSRQRSLNRDKGRENIILCVQS